MRFERALKNSWNGVQPFDAPAARDAALFCEKEKEAGHDTGPLAS